MKIIETLDWILDNYDETMTDEDKYRLNREFVHLLGLKCDCVGWSTLNLQNPRANEILSAIDAFCKKNGWKARGCYHRTYSDYTSDWYEIVPTAFNDNTLCGSVECEGKQGKNVEVYNIRAYHEPRPAVKYWYESVLVPERFRDACIRHGITDVDFCWARDMGKYQAEQYFHLYGNCRVPTIAVGKDITINDKEKIELLGGYLPRIADIFYNLQKINLQDSYIESDIPSCNIAYAYCPRTYSYIGKNNFLIHKNFAQILLNEKAISESDLTPAMVVKELPGGYTLDNTITYNRPTSVYLQKSISEYEKLKNTQRPLRLISEKDALKIMRSAKKERKEDFQKPLSKTKVSDIAKTSYAPILPYYLIANGGHFSDEYEFLKFDKAVEENELFTEELLTEELLESKPDGIVFAKCANGDMILHCDNGKVIRFSHEAPVAIEEWASLSQFVADAINE